MLKNIFGDVSKLCAINKSLYNYLPVRYARTRHRVVKYCITDNYQPWAKPVNIKDIIGNYDQLDPSEMRDHLRRHGLLPNKIFQDRQVNFNCTASVIDDFIPPEDDGKSSFLSVSKVKETSQTVTGQVKNVTATRQIRKYDSDFKRKKFVDVGNSIYLEVLSILPNYKNNESRLLELVTEKAIGDMLKGLDNKTLVHSFHKHLEPPSLISVRTQAGMTEGQIFAQVMLRFFSEQTIAIYDKFGRLIYGSRDIPQDVLEYVVFEKQISEEFGNWRIHAKLIPNWVTNRLVYRRTLREKSQSVPESEMSNKMEA